MENKIVSLGGRVISDGKEYEITSVNFLMTSTGSLNPYLPMLEYYGKPVNKEGKVMEHRTQVLLRRFTKSDGSEYIREHVCYIGENTGRYMHG